MLSSLTSWAVMTLLLASPLMTIAHADSGSVGEVMPHAQLVERKASASIKSLFANSPKTYPTPDVIVGQPRSAWTTAYNKAKQAGKIPNIPPTTLVNYWPTYPASYKGNPCNFYTQKCSRSTDIVTSPAGIVGISFDDGPYPVAPTLLSYLKSQKIHATHFTIGSRIYYNQDLLIAMDTAGDHIAGHTWSHPYMTTLTDMQVLAEIGWVLQIIYDLTGKVPAYFRFPFGDCDDRTRAIAQEVFKLTVVGWTEDPRDWCLSDAAGPGSACSVGDGPQNIAELNAELASYVKNTKKSDGLIILEHENGIRPINAFKKLLPQLLKKGWKPRAIPDMFTPPRAWYAS